MSVILIWKQADIKNLDKREQKEFINNKIEAAASGIFGTLESRLKQKYSHKKIINLINDTDLNQDGKITSAEAKIKDTDNIFKLAEGTSDKELNNLNKNIKKEQELCGIKGMEKGLKTNNLAWKVAKPIIKNYTDKSQIKNMFQSSQVRHYYETEMRNDPSTIEHLRELLQEWGFTKSEIIKMGFSEEIADELI